MTGFTLNFVFGGWGVVGSWREGVVKFVAVWIVVIVSCHTPCQSTLRDSTELIFIMPAALLVERNCKPTAKMAHASFWLFLKAGSADAEPEFMRKAPLNSSSWCQPPCT